VLKASVKFWEIYKISPNWIPVVRFWYKSSWKQTPSIALENKKKKRWTSTRGWHDRQTAGQDSIPFMPEAIHSQRVDSKQVYAGHKPSHIRLSFITWEAAAA